MKIGVLGSASEWADLCQLYLSDLYCEIHLLPCDVPCPSSMDLYLVLLDESSPLSWGTLEECYLKIGHNLNWMICSFESPNMEQAHLLLKYPFDFIHLPIDRQQFLQKVL